MSTSSNGATIHMPNILKFVLNKPWKPCSLLLVQQGSISISVFLGHEYGKQQNLKLSITWETWTLQDANKVIAKPSINYFSHNLPKTKTTSALNAYDWKLHKPSPTPIQLITRVKHSPFPCPNKEPSLLSTLRSQYPSISRNHTSTRLLKQRKPPHPPPPTPQTSPRPRSAPSRELPPRSPALASTRPCWYWSCSPSRSSSPSPPSSGSRSSRSAGP
jgi:hypothetical protein